MFAYMESLVARKIFPTINVPFLPFEYTHEEKDQAFSCIEERLRSKDAPMVSDLHRQLMQTYGGRVNWVHMEYFITR